MSLKSFHIFFIFTALALLGFLAYWGYTTAYTDSETMMYCSAGGLALLMTYVVWFIRNNGKLR